MTAVVLVLALLGAPKADKAKQAQDAKLERFEKIVQRIDGDFSEEKKQLIAAAYIKAQEDQTPQALDRARQRLQDQIKLIPEVGRDTLKKLRAAIKDQKEYIKKLGGKDAVRYVVPQIDKIAVTAVGTIPISFKVLQILTDKEMICDVGEDTAWVTGISTLGLTDGDRIRTDDDYIMFVSGTKKYDTVIGGSRTVYVIEPVIKFNK